MSSIFEYRQQGNCEFIKGNLDSSIELYGLAIGMSGSETGELVKCYNNRALCLFKLERFEDACHDCLNVLSIEAVNVKAGYRYAMCLEKLDRLPESLKVISNMLRNNDQARQDKECVEFFQTITAKIKKMTAESQSTNNRATQCLDICFNIPASADRMKAINNMIVLAIENDGARALEQCGFVEKLSEAYGGFNVSDKKELLKILSTIVQRGNADRARRVLKAFPVVRLCSMIALEVAEVSDSSARVLDRLLFKIADLEEKRKTKKPINVSFTFDPDVSATIDEIFRTTATLIGEQQCHGQGRDNFLNFLLKYADQENSCAWTRRLIPLGLPKMLRIAASVPGHLKCLPLTENTRMHVACTMCAIYDDLCSDRDREEYRATCDNFIRILSAEEQQPKVRTVACLGTLLQGPFDVGNSILGNQGMVETIIFMAQSPKNDLQRIALDAILLSSSKSDKAAGILHQGCKVLKKLYSSTNEDIKVRALLGLCKICSSKGTDFSKKTVSEQNLEKLEKTCCSFLLPTKSKDCRLNAADGLAYLTLDGDLKELLINDQASMTYLLALPQEYDVPSLNFAIASILLNLSNAVLMKRPDEEMIKLAKYSKHHVPEEHPKDAKEFYEARRKTLMTIGVSPTIVKLAKENSDACKSIVSKVVLALCEDIDHRGILVAAGVGKVLLPLALGGSGSIEACQALARIAISCNPEIAFPGQRCIELIRPLVKLLHPDRTGLENFEALLAFTNLASLQPSVRTRIIEDAFSSIEHYMFEEHAMIRRAATEAVCNLCVDENILSKFTAENDRVKMLILFCGQDDLDLNRAATGCLAQLSHAQEIREKIVKVNDFAGLLKQVATAEDVELQYRAFYILRNLIVDGGMDVANRVVDTDLMDVTFAMSRYEDDKKDRKKILELAKEIIKHCLEHEYIKPTMNTFSQ